MTRMLLVDDDENFSHVLSRALNRRGFNVTVANGSSEALAMSEQHFDQAIIDLKLADNSGLALIAELKRRQPALEIVMLTGYSSVATAVEAVKLGAINYLCKPANTDEILAAFGHQAANITTAIPQNRPSIDRLEWEHIQKVLLEQGGNISATARVLGMHRRTLQRKLNKRPVKDPD